MIGLDRFERFFVTLFSCILGVDPVLKGRFMFPPISNDEKKHVRGSMNDVSNENENPVF